MMKIVNLEQGSSDWHQWRQGGIGSSEAPILLHGEHFGTSVLDLWRKKTKLETPEEERRGNWAMEQGKKTEPESRAWYESLMDVKAPPVCAMHAEHAWLRASLDGWHHASQTLLEIKYASKDRHSQALDGEVPVEYQPQIWHQCLVASTGHAHYVSFNPRFPAGQRRVMVNYRPLPAELDLLLRLEITFMELVQRLKPPAPGQFGRHSVSQAGSSGRQ